MSQCFNSTPCLTGEATELGEWLALALVGFVMFHTFFTGHIFGFRPIFPIKLYVPVAANVLGYKASISTITAIEAVLFAANRTVLRNVAGFYGPEKFLRR